MSQQEGGYTVVIVPKDAEHTRSFQITPRGLRIGALASAAGLVVLAVVLASWWYFAAEAARVPELKREIARLEEENAKVQQLGAAVSRLQEQSERISTMLGADVMASSGLPDPGAAISNTQWSLAGVARASSMEFMMPVITV